MPIQWDKSNCERLGGKWNSEKRRCRLPDALESETIDRLSYEMRHVFEEIETLDLDKSRMASGIFSSWKKVEKEMDDYLVLYYG